MTASECWDERYRSGEHAGDGPDAFLGALLRYRPLLGPAKPKALDIACGAGRHAVELARAGFDVSALDRSREALKLTGERAAAAGVSVTARQVDLEMPNVDLGAGLFDLAVVFYFLDRPLIPKLIAALRPGGLVVYKTFIVAAGGSDKGPKNASYRLRPNELLDLFCGFRVLRYEEECVAQGSGDAATAALIAQKPR